MQTPSVPQPPPALLPSPVTGVKALGGLTGVGYGPGPRLCAVCSSSSHLKRNCPQLVCSACGVSGHVREDCRQVPAVAQERPPVYTPAVAGGDSAQAEGGSDGLRQAVCRACGSSRHVQANCPARMQTIECYRCHQVGHIVNMCPQTRCYNCGTYGHSSQVCLSKPHCFHCSNAGHRSSECPIKYKGRVCYQCKEPGHEAANCPQGQLCRMCRQPGHLVARCPEVQCNTCHEMGHTSGVCDKVVCSHCGGTHNTHMCRTPGWQYSYNTYQDSFQEEAGEVKPPQASLSPSQQSLPASGGPQESSAAVSPQPAEPSAGADECSTPSTAPTLPQAIATSQAAKDSEASPDPAAAAPEPVGLLSPTFPALSADPHAIGAIPAYVPTGEARSGRVAVVIDGPYFERCVRSSGSNPHHTADYHTRVTEALQHTLQYIGDIFRMEPIAFWFDTDPAAFTEFLETAMPLAHRESAFRETALRKKYLTDEMNGGRTLHNVVARLVGGMKRQYGYTREGPGYVWVQTGVDVAISTAVIEHFHDEHRYQQVVLLCGDSDVYPAVHYCNQLRSRAQSGGAARCPVRVCGTSTSMSKLYGQHQDLSDFLPRILLDRPSHAEGGRVVHFPPSVVFS